jgi:hypothetical protein
MEGMTPLGNYIGQISNREVCFANSTESYFRQLEEFGSLPA